MTSIYKMKGKNNMELRWKVLKKINKIKMFKKIILSDFVTFIKF